MNIGALLDHPRVVRERVLGIQTKLHRWAVVDRDRRFDDLFNLVADPAFLVMAWTRVRENMGAKTAGIDGATAWSIENSEQGVAGFLAELRSSVKDRSFRPVPVRTVMIPKANGKRRRLAPPHPSSSKGLRRWVSSRPWLRELGEPTTVTMAGCTVAWVLGTASGCWRSAVELR